MLSEFFADPYGLLEVNTKMLSALLWPWSCIMWSYYIRVLLRIEIITYFYHTLIFMWKLGKFINFLRTAVGASKSLHRPGLFLRNRAKVVFRSPYSLFKKLYAGKGKGYAGPKSAFGSPHCLFKNFRCERGEASFLFSYRIFMYMCYVKKVFSICIVNI